MFKPAGALGLRTFPDMAVTKPMSESADPLDAYKAFMAKHNKPVATKAGNPGASDKTEENNKPDANNDSRKKPGTSSTAKDGKVYETYTYDERSQPGGEGAGMPSATKTRTSRAENPVEEVDEDEPVDVRPRWRASDFPPNIVDMDTEATDATAAATVDHDAREDLDDDDDDDADVAAHAPVHRPTTAITLASLLDKITDRAWRNLAILLGACLGAAYEVAVLPSTRRNFNRAVYALTGTWRGESPLSSSAGRALSAIDFYAILADVFGAVAFFGANVACAIAAVIVTVRIIKVFTGMNESALNFICIPFTWGYAKGFVDDVTADEFGASTLGWYQRHGASLGLTVAAVETMETVAPVTTRGLCLGLCFSALAADFLSFAGGFVWVLALLLATWTARFVLRLALKLLTPIFPPADQLKNAMPDLAVVPGLVSRAAHGLLAGGAAGAKAARHVGAGVGKGAVNLSVKGIKGAGAIGAGVGVKGIRGSIGAGKAAGGIAVGGARAGMAVGGAAARGTLFGIVGATRAGLGAGAAATRLGVKGTVLAGKTAASAPGYVWRTTGRIRSFVKLVTVQAEAALDPVAPKLKRALHEDGKLPSKVPREYRKPKKGVTPAGGGGGGGLAAKLDKLQEESKKNARVTR